MAPACNQNAQDVVEFQTSPIFPSGKSQKIFVSFKVHIFWEGHKIWKNLPPDLTQQLSLLSNVKTSGRIFQIFVAFSEKLDSNDNSFISKELNDEKLDLLVYFCAF